MMMIANIVRSQLAAHNKASLMTRCLTTSRIGIGLGINHRPYALNKASLTTQANDMNKIESAQIVYIVGGSGSGKTFSGDYLDVMHKYQHVDGDIPLKHMTLVPEYKEIVEKLFVEDDWEPFHSEIARLTAEAAKDHDRVVVSHATWKNEQRDHVINKLIECGAGKENITLILLTIDQRVKLRGMYHRTKRMAEQSGVTMTEFCKEVMSFEGEMTEEKYIDIRLEEEAAENELYGGFDDYHPEAIIVDSTIRDATRFDNIDKALGLTRPEDLTYEDICAQVKPLDEARDKKVMESGFLEAYTDVLARAEELMKQPEEK